MIHESRGASETHHIKLDRHGSLHVRAWPGNGEPLVLLHGLMSSSATWNAVAAATTRPCFALDLPGFGRSSPPSRSRLTEYAEAVVAALDRLDVDSFTLVGHSFGGAVATAVAERLPNETCRLALLAPAGFGRLPLAEFAALPLIRHLAVGMAPCVERRPPHPQLVRATTLRSVRLRHPRVAGELRPGLRAAIEALAHNSRSWGTDTRRVAYSGAVAAVWGERDGVIPPSHVRRLTAALPQAEVYLRAAGGHSLHREQPDDLARFLETGMPAGLLDMAATNLSGGTELRAAARSQRALLRRPALQAAHA